MKVQIVVTMDGRITAVVEEGEFGEAKERLERLFADLEAAGLTFSEIGEVEAHRHETGKEIQRVGA